MSHSNDERFMTAALALGERGLGTTWPNPSVGCVIVRDGRVVGRGWTQPGGRPHAETEALARAGDGARGAIAYVTLEPCAHHGQTPPCVEALIAAGIARVVIACEDPDPRTRGLGIARLKQAGIEVVIGVGEMQALRQHEGFFLRVRQNRPLVSLKTATSLDGRIATRGGESQWITSEASRMQGRALRSRHDAVITGIGTALADNPQYTTRLPGLPNPVRIVVDTFARLPLTSHLADTSLAPTWLLTCDNPEHQAARDALAARGVEVIALPSLAVPAILEALALRGITRLLVEAGVRLTTAFLLADAVDRLHWFRAPVVIGGDGQPAAHSLEIQHLADARRYETAAVTRLGADVIEVLHKRK